MTPDNTEIHSHWDYLDGIDVRLEVRGSMELKQKLAAAIEEILEESSDSNRD